ncbi:MAG: oxygen-dependent coproporphyrinogen oxidase [Saprospiraceae bacterium]|nr:oxygen-dependent coproporphyrinogen oxidase [Saprospiraceae bacterium]
MIDKELIANRFRVLQDNICQALESADGGGIFSEDNWTRPEGGGGRSRVLEGNTIEKGGVMFSAVHGPLPEITAKAMNLAPTDFFATGVSIVLHPHSPLAPIIHMNVRYFETSGGERWWFGGGIDLTPHYVVPEDAQYFHQQLKQTCDRFAPHFYPDFKKHADDYFYIRHRKETRGVGGIFYDYLDEKTGFTQEQLFDFSLAVGETFAPTYTELLQRAVQRPYTEREKRWQMLRRGRYVEFNLVWDRGTKFGLETNGRTESILMSMPPTAQWAYNLQPEPGSPEADTLEWLRKGVDWVG